MKKLTVVAVLLAFLLNIMGFFIIFKCQQYLLQQEMASDIARGPVKDRIVVFALKDLRNDGSYRQINEKEFTFKGKLYDIVVKKTIDRGTFVFCLHDKKEDRLVSIFNIILRSRDRNSRRDNSLPALFHNLVKQALVRQVNYDHSEPAILIHYPVLTFRFTPVYLPLIFPPPERG